MENLVKHRGVRSVMHDGVIRMQLSVEADDVLEVAGPGRTEHAPRLDVAPRGWSAGGISNERSSRCPVVLTVLVTITYRRSACEDLGPAIEGSR